MKKIFILVSFLYFYNGAAQSLPFYFEDTLTNPSFIDFNGGTSSIIPNPFVGGINTSDSVARIVRNGGDLWAGSKIILANNLDFSVLTKISMKVYTTAPIGTIAKLKLEGSGSSVEIDAYTSQSGAWETLEWIFAGTPNNLNELVFMFDFGKIGNGSASSTFYFDDLEQVAGPPAPVPASLPISFENDVTGSDFLNFSGAVASVILNPHKTGINTSDTVAQIVRNGGDIWAGSTLLLNDSLDFSTNWQISMKVYTDAPVGTRMKMQLNGPNSSTTLDVLTTTSGNWETLSWNFYGQPNTFNRMAFLFDFGNLGDGSNTSTFLFDDIEQVSGPIITAPQANSLPIDFESNVVSTDFINQFGSFGTVISNPQSGGTNTSATVGQIIKSGGQPWARSKLILSNNMDFSSLSSISVRVYSDAPIGTMLKLKVESTNTAAANERDVFTSVSGAWATYTWDFAGDPPIYDVITFMMDYGTIGDASPNSTFLIDDIKQVMGPPPTPKATLPIRFDDQVNTSYFSDFDGAGVRVVANSEKNGSNLSDSVALMVRNGGQIYAGSKLFLDKNIDFSSYGYISMKVFTAAPVGTILKLKLENDGGTETEVDMLTTASGSWETIRWNFSGQPSVYNSIVFMFDFGSVGDSSSSSTFLFDDIEQTNSTGGTIGLNTYSKPTTDLKLYPNPVNEFVNIISEDIIESILIYNIQGRLISTYYPNEKTQRLSLSSLSSGLYSVVIKTEGNISVRELIKQ